MFGDVAKWITSSLHYAQTLDDFKNSLATFVYKHKRPHEQHKLVVVLDSVRSWKPSSAMRICNNYCKSNLLGFWLMEASSFDAAQN